jgi:hypothetical protein
MRYFAYLSLLIIILSVTVVVVLFVKERERIIMKCGEQDGYVRTMKDSNVLVCKEFMTEKILFVKAIVPRL